MLVYSALFLSISCIFTLQIDAAWDDDKILLTGMKALTLTEGQMTKGRRSTPIQQLTCVGGSAGCHRFVPKVVQCTNMGTDGYDVQWECKTDMDKAYKFGRISVNCEGYNYPDDPHILRGSCGLEYSIDYSGAGQQDYNSYGTKNYSKSSSGFGHLIILAIIGLVVYGVYKTCVSRSGQDRSDRPYPEPSAPPPPGFRPEYTQGRSHGCHSAGFDTGSNAPNAGGGFWSGAGLGGLMGYFMGSRNNGGRTYTNYGYPANRQSGSWWGGENTGTSGWGNRSRDSGTRTASGYGGTTRR